MKAVIWTDVFQTCVMLAGILAAIIQVSILAENINSCARNSKKVIGYTTGTDCHGAFQGCIKVGGASEVWRISEEGGRIEFIE